MRDGQLVPAAVAPQTVDRIEHVQQRQVILERQPVPGGRTHFAEGHIGLHEVHQPHLAAVRVTQESAHQALVPATALQVLDQGQQRALPGVQRHEVDEVEQARFLQFAQLRVDEAPAERDAGVRPFGLDGLGDPQRPVDGAWKGNRQQHQVWGVPGQYVPREVGQCPVQQVRRCGQRIGQGVEVGLAGGQSFGVADELKARVHRVADHVGQVVEVQRGQMACAVLQAHGAEGPAQRVAALALEGGVRIILIDRGESRAFGQEGTGVDAVCQGGVSALQERDRGLDRGTVAGERFKEVGHAGRVFDAAVQGRLTQLVQPRPRQHTQHQLQRQIVLFGLNTPRSQEARDIGGAGVGRVELRHRRDEAQDLERCSAHAAGILSQRRPGAARDNVGVKQARPPLVRGWKHRTGGRSGLHRAAQELTALHREVRIRATETSRFSSDETGNLCAQQHQVGRR